MPRRSSSRSPAGSGGGRARNTSSVRRKAVLGVLTAAAILSLGLWILWSRGEVDSPAGSAATDEAIRQHLADEAKRATAQRGRAPDPLPRDGLLAVSEAWRPPAEAAAEGAAVRFPGRPMAPTESVAPASPGPPELPLVPSEVERSVRRVGTPRAPVANRFPLEIPESP